ncbi:Hpt domain-containing protein [Thiomicrorhabdus sp. ZW0627]|uniref:Hpt domain-containing protein n=1 Tax=Thiomicrorhabdus sp. ZW0627 TaxID=3039774 RepID=UPI0024369CCB|nr:Hpt domain-containing protein [Thiomicrorhabdus sp. ZW0627]MDG6774514.1 Hpt domain-containing protein [Thiomicrorhabdus sp. ZW0627]
MQSVSLSGVLSQKRLDELNAMIGEQLPVILNTYIETSIQNVEELETAFQSLNYTILSEVSHKLKGSSASIGATNLPNQCVELESKLQNTSDINEISKVLSMIKSENSAIIHNLKNYLNSLNP